MVGPRSEPPSKRPWPRPVPGPVSRHRARARSRHRQDGAVHGADDRALGGVGGEGAEGVTPPGRDCPALAFDRPAPGPDRPAIRRIRAVCPERTPMPGIGGAPVSVVRAVLPPWPPRHRPVPVSRPVRRPRVLYGGPSDATLSPPAPAAAGTWPRSGVRIRPTRPGVPRTTYRLVTRRETSPHIDAPALVRTHQWQLTGTCKIFEMPRNGTREGPGSLFTT